MKPQFVRTLRGAFLPVSAILQYDVTQNGVVVCFTFDSIDGATRHDLSNQPGVKDGERKLRNILEAINSGVSIVSDFDDTPERVFSQIIPADREWYAAYVWGETLAVDYLPLFAWALVEGESDVVPLVYLDGMAEEADKVTPDQFIGIVEPNRLKIDFEEQNAYAINKAALGNRAVVSAAESEAAQNAG